MNARATTSWVLKHSETPAYLQRLINMIYIGTIIASVAGMAGSFVRILQSLLDNKEEVIAAYTIFRNIDNVFHCLPFLDHESLPFATVLLEDRKV